MAALIKNQAKKVEVSVDKWWNSSNSISVFVSGKTGVGKSTLVNALLGEKGEKVAKEGGTLDPETSEVEPFTEHIQGMEVTVWDSPGLQDGTENEDKYLEDIKSKCNGEIDLLLYCISMNDSRFVSGSRDIKSMNKLTTALGPEIWENAVVILTRANTEIRLMKKMLADPESVEAKFNERLEEWKSKIVHYLKKDVKLSVKVAQKVPILPAGRIESPFLFKDSRPRPWLSHLWIESLAATKLRAQPALIKMNINRLIKSSDIKNEDGIEDLLRRQKIIIHDKAIEVGKKTLFVNPERANIAGQVVFGRSLRAENVQDALTDILPHIHIHADKFPDIVISAMDKLITTSTL